MKISFSVTRIGSWKRMMLLMWILLTQVAFGQKKVCLSVDDLPFASYGPAEIRMQQGLMKQMVATLDRHHIPAIGFLIGDRLQSGNHQNPAAMAIMRNWMKHGLELGNHTSTTQITMGPTYPDMPRTSFASIP
ncbi:MAG: polysaccharide deacetylase family protein [Marinilabiliales bacterium]|nr:polysaccharide deacetylase family protein [Marinilabiliales bacterium]